MGWAVAIGLLRGYKDASLRPAGSVTRVEVAAIMYRFVNSIRRG